MFLKMEKIYFPITWNIVEQIIFLISGTALFQIFQS